jgi:nitric oxide reductase subunit C
MARAPRAALTSDKREAREVTNDQGRARPPARVSPDAGTGGAKRMSELLTKSAARNIFYGGSAFFFAVFVGLVAHTHMYAINTSSDAKGLTAAVENGKRVWEKHACINCHTILGEGAYFAPEVGNVFLRYGGDKDPATARQLIKDWMKAQPSGAPGRRQMPQFHLSDKELDDLAAFFEWVSKINTQNWPPNKAG